MENNNDLKNNFFMKHSNEGDIKILTSRRYDPINNSLKVESPLNALALRGLPANYPSDFKQDASVEIAIGGKPFSMMYHDLFKQNAPQYEEIKTHDGPNYYNEPFSAGTIYTNGFPDINYINLTKIEDEKMHSDILKKDLSLDGLSLYIACASGDRLLKDRESILTGINGNFKDEIAKCIEDEKGLKALQEIKENQEEYKAYVSDIFDQTQALKESKLDDLYDAKTLADEMLKNLDQDPADEQ